MLKSFFLVCGLLGLASCTHDTRSGEEEGQSIGDIDFLQTQFSPEISDGVQAIANALNYKCPKGYRCLPVLQCLPCDYGTYKSDKGAGMCRPCPGGCTTLRKGAEDKRECVPKCPPGFEESSCGKTCMRCRPGYYKSSWKNARCHRCPRGANWDPNTWGNRRMRECYGSGGKPAEEETKTPSHPSGPPPTVTGQPHPSGLPTPVTGQPHPSGPPTPVTGQPHPSGPPTPVTGQPHPSGPPTPVTGQPHPSGPPTPVTTVTGQPHSSGLPTPVTTVTGHPHSSGLPPTVSGQPHSSGPPTPVTTVTGQPHPSGPPTPVTGQPHSSGPPTTATVSGQPATVTAMTTTSPNIPDSCFDEVESCSISPFMLIPMNGSCSKYCQCSPLTTSTEASYFWQQRSCSPYTLYDDFINSCVWQEDVDCTDDTTDSPTDPGNTDGSITGCPTSTCSYDTNVLIKSQGSNCSSFCQCTARDNSPEYHWVQMPCSAGTLFDADGGICDHAASVTCEESTTTTTTSTTNTTSPATVSVCETHGIACDASTASSDMLFHLPDTGCLEYCECDQTTSSWSVKICPPGELFAEDFDECVEESYVIPPTCYTIP